MTYGLVLSERAIKDIAVLKKSEPQAYKKLVKLLTSFWNTLLQEPDKWNLLKGIKAVYGQEG